MMKHFFGWYGKPGWIIMLAALLLSWGCEPGDMEEKTVVLTTDAPDNHSIRISNRGFRAVAFAMELNGQKFFDSIDDVTDQIASMADAFDGESSARKVWRFVRDNRYHDVPLGQPETHTVISGPADPARRRRIRPASALVSTAARWHHRVPGQATTAG